ncbi:hypothetical protein MNBD_GAMMA01-71 [hydrothermal vent metagenome]|uniref:Peptidase M48 domain-containing protein n=1 Tax=hydrothermal vent metagenome TaxID=652676 RepID=A0A3B0WAY5_9ZZZZ
MRSYFILLCIISIGVLAKTDVQLIKNISNDNERKLLEKYSTIESAWFELHCMQLANKMKFKHILQCKMIDSPYINAYVFASGHVYFSLAMMRQINNKHQWASILAHENAHLELKHYLKTLKKIQKPGIFFPKAKINKLLKKHEQQADDWSRQRLLQYGFDPHQIYFFLQRVAKISATNKTSNNLNLIKRIKHNKTKELINKELTKYMHNPNWW